MIQSNDINIPLGALELVRHMDHTAAYLKVNKREEIWKQIARMIEQERNVILNKALEQLKERT